MFKISVKLLFPGRGAGGGLTAHRFTMRRANAAKDNFPLRVGEMSKGLPRAPAIRPSPKSVVTLRDAEFIFSC